MKMDRHETRKDNGLPCIRHRATLSEFRRAVDQEPTNAAALHRVGIALVERGEAVAATEFLAKAAQIDRAKYGRDFADTLTRLQRWDDAAQVYRSTLATLGGVSELWARLGGIYEQLGDWEEARNAHLQAIELSPNWIHGYAGLYRTCIVHRSALEGEALARKSIRSRGKSLISLLGLAKALEQHGRYPEAHQYWEEALTESPDNVTALLGAGTAKLATRNLDGARQNFDRAFERYPFDVWVRLEQFFFRLRIGLLAEARQVLCTEETRKVLRGVGLRSHPDAAPHWDGTQDLEGKTVFVENRGGFGDTIQFSRFAWMLKQQGARVIVQCQPALQRLLRSLPGADEVVAPYDECAPFDYQCRPDYAGFLMNWDWSSLKPDPPYITPNITPRQTVPTLGANSSRNCLKVGVAWLSAAQDHENCYTFRSVPLEALRPLTSVPDTRFFGLQVRAQGRGSGNWLAANLGEHFKDFSDAAAATLTVDVVVAADSAMAHLAGALGKLCFVLLPYFADWRWINDSAANRSACPWYPTVRLFRQTRPGDWGEVVKALSSALKDLLSPPAEPRA